MQKREMAVSPSCLTEANPQCRDRSASLLDGEVLPRLLILGQPATFSQEQEQHMGVKQTIKKKQGEISDVGIYKVIKKKRAKPPSQALWIISTAPFPAV